MTTRALEVGDLFSNRVEPRGEGSAWGAWREADE